MRREPNDALAAALASRFSVGEEVGRGGASIVYRGSRISDGLVVAIKVLREEVAGSVTAERFLREIDIESRLRHEHIVPLLDSGTAGRVPYLVTPFADGGSLRALLDREHVLPVEEALEITRDVAAALVCANAQGIVHRDVKPENILIAGGRAQLVDFGIARVLGQLGGERLTESGVVLGTPAYMSPEQGAGDRTLDARSDLYSLACVLYEMLAGDPPFPGRSMRATIARHASEAAPSVRIARPAVPPGVEYALLRALGKSPDDRFADVAEFARALDTPPPTGWLSPIDAGAAREKHRRR